MFETIDQILSAAGAAIFLFCYVRCARGRSFRGLVDPVDRANALRQDSVMAAVVAYFLASTVLAVAAGTIFSESDDIRSSLLVGNGAHVIGLIACLLIASKLFTGGVKAFLFGCASPRGQLSVGAFLGLAIVALGLCPLVHDGTVIAVRYFAEGYEFPAHPTIAALGGEGVESWVVVALWMGASVIAPLAEEAFFRGILQTFLLNMFRNRRTAILLSSLAFGLVHFPQPETIPALVLFGVVLGYSYERSGSLMVPVMLHAVFNLKTLIWYAASGSPE